MFISDPFREQIHMDTLPLPAATFINGCKIPYFFIADNAFPLSLRIMKSYSPSVKKALTTSERIFNYRARRCVVNSFGVLTKKWGCLRRPLCLVGTNEEL